MGAKCIPSWNIVLVKGAEGAEVEATCQTTGDEDSISGVPRTHTVEQKHERTAVQPTSTKQRRYSSANEKLTNFKHLSESAHDINDSCSSSRTQSASSDSDLEKRRLLRKFKDAGIEVRLETKRLLSTVKHKFQGSRETPVKQIHLLPESDANRWACKPAISKNRANSRTNNGMHSYSTTNLHVLQDVDNDYITQNRLDAL
ncbi:hypothetical protein BsWGS_01849 [Bradybaena similaris]